MARLAHPNVVAVFEAGLTEPDVHVCAEALVFIAMEFVQGRTLREWLAEGAPTVAEILAVFVQAGGGLAATHAAGLVHRDFKPDNVLVGDDGRVRVADLGLARASLGSQPSGAAPTDPAAPGGNGGDRLTATGVAAGTPAYMAPEQFLAEDIDARADQFAFCVALWEALYGERPFPGRSRIEIAAGVIDGEPSVPARRAEAPARVYEILRVGLAREPAARHPSMEALLAALVADPRRRRRRVLAGGVGVVAIAGGVWLGTRIGGGAAPNRPCDGAAAAIEAVWNDARREHLVDVMLAVPVPYAEPVSIEVAAGVDAYTRAWVSSAQDACEATRIRGEQSETLFDRRRRCLDRRQRDLKALLRVLDAPDAVTIERAPAAVLALPDVASCNDAEHVSAQVEPPTDRQLAARVEAIRDRIAHVVALRGAGRIDEALLAARAALAEARAESYPPIVAEVLLVAGETADIADTPGTAEAWLREAYLSALRLGLDDVAAGAASRLVYTVGYAHGRSDAGEEWALHARALLERPGIDPARRMSLRNHEAAVAWHDGDYARAEQGFNEVYERWVQVHGPRSSRAAVALTNLGALAYAREDAPAAIAAFEEVLSIQRERLGEQHPEVGRALVQLGAGWWLAGDGDKALDHFERGLVSLRAARGEDELDVAGALMNLAGVEVGLERYGPATDHLERACAIYEAYRGPEHSSVGRCLHNLTVARFHAGDATGVDALAGRSLQILRHALPAVHPEVVRAVRLSAEIAEARGDLVGAREAWSEVLEAREESGASPSDRGDARFGLGRATWTGRGGQADADAIRDVRRAQAELAAAGVDDDAAAAEAWLVARGPRSPRTGDRLLRDGRGRRLTGGVAPR